MAGEIQTKSILTTIPNGNLAEFPIRWKDWNFQGILTWNQSRHDGCHPGGIVDASSVIAVSFLGWAVQFCCFYRCGLGRADIPLGSGDEFLCGGVRVCLPIWQSSQTPSVEFWMIFMPSRSAHCLQFLEVSLFPGVFGICAP